MDEAVRVGEPNGKQPILHPTDLDGLIEPGHPARAIWQVLEKLDLSRFYEPIKAREGIAGRDATDPRVRLALWLCAISQGVNSAREIARLCEEHAAYRWICGGVGVNYHTLSDFRSARQAAREGAAREYEQRCAQALEQFEQLSAHKAQAKNHPQRRTETRISTTDPEARVMKLGDGGFAPAYNLQLATDPESRIIVGLRARPTRAATAGSWSRCRTRFSGAPQPPPSSIWPTAAT